MNVFTHTHTHTNFSSLMISFCEHLFKSFYQTGFDQPNSKATKNLVPLTRCPRNYPGPPVIYAEMGNGAAAGFPLGQIKGSLRAVRCDELKRGRRFRGTPLCGRFDFRGGIASSLKQKNVAQGELDSSHVIGTFGSKIFVAAYPGSDSTLSRRYLLDGQSINKFPFHTHTKWRFFVRINNKIDIGLSFYCTSLFLGYEAPSWLVLMSYSS